MEVIRKLPSISKIWLARRKITDVAVTYVNPVCITVVSSDPEDTTVRESQNTNRVEIFNVEDEIRRPTLQNQTFSIADDAFGDISSFLQISHDENEQLPLPVGSLDIEDRLTSMESPPSNSVVSQHLQNAELEIIEAAQSPEIAHESVRNVQSYRKVYMSNTEIKYKPSVYIHTHFDLMYIFGTCAYRTMSKNSTNERKTRMYQVATGIQKALFVAVVILSTFQSFCDAKYYLLWFLAGGGLNQLVRFAFNLTTLGSCAYGAHILCRNGNDMKKMVQAMNTYEKDWEGKRAQPAFSFALAIFTVVLASVKAFLLVGFDEMSMDAILLQSSHELSEDLFIWSSADLNITTLQLETKFGTSLNSITILMGTVKILRNFASALLHGMIWDIIGNVVLIMMCWMHFFMTFVHTVAENVPDESIIEENVPEKNPEDVNGLQRQRVVVWKMYRQIRIVFAAVNEVFGPMLMLFHVTNVLRYAFFMERIIYPEDATPFEYIHILYDIVKSEIVYFIATNIAKQNKMIRKWLRNWALRTGKIELGYTEMDITVVLDELDEEPLGLGQGDLVIHQGFHFGLLGLVSSLFVMLANKTGAKV